MFYFILTGIFLLLLIIIIWLIYKKFYFAAIVLIILSLIILNWTQIDRYFKIRLSSYDYLYFLDKIYHNLPRVKSSDRVVLSFTTMPERLDDIKFTLMSLLDQSHRVDQINICIPYKMKRSGKEYIIPDYLKALKNINILRCQDYGPSTKLLPTLLNETNNTKIIYLDDDRIYGSRLVKNLVKFSEKYPDRVICNFGWNLPHDRNYLTHRKHLVSTYLGKFGNVDIIEGCEGCLVKPKFFDLNALADYSNAPQEAFYVDDIWISGHLAKQKVIRYRMPFHLHSRGYSIDSEIYSPALMAVNINGHNNNTIIKYFDHFW